MPYNNTPITPPTEPTGTVSLPLARVKKIINVDPDIGACSNNAAFTIAVATEMFIQHLVEQSHTVVKAEKRPRRNLQYRDVANAVSRIDNLEFLSDVVPRTMTYKSFKEKKAAKEHLANTSAGNNHGARNGQRTLDQLVTKGEQQQDEREDSEMTYLSGDDFPGSEVEKNEEDEDEDEDKEIMVSEVKPRGRHNYDAVRDEIHEGTPMED